MAFQQSGKQDSFRHIFKGSVSMCESSGSEFYRKTNGIQSIPDATNESMLVMTLLTIFGVTEILCSFRLVLEKKKTGKGIPESSRLEFLEMLFANNFALSDTEGNASRSFTFLTNDIRTLLRWPFTYLPCEFNVFDISNNIDSVFLSIHYYLLVLAPGSFP